MAINPPLGADGFPLKLPGEQFILERPGIDFQLKLEKSGKFKGSGNLVLTTKRLVLINSKASKNDKFNSFEIPLVLIFNEKFKQPIFGANYWMGYTKPL